MPSRGDDGLSNEAGPPLPTATRSHAWGFTQTVDSSIAGRPQCIWRAPRQSPSADQSLATKMAWRQGGPAPLAWSRTPAAPHPPIVWGRVPHAQQRLAAASPRVPHPHLVRPPRLKRQQRWRHEQRVPTVSSARVARPPPPTLPPQPTPAPMPLPPAPRRATAPPVAGVPPPPDRAHSAAAHPTAAQTRGGGGRGERQARARMREWLGTRPAVDVTTAVAAAVGTTPELPREGRGVYPPVGVAPPPTPTTRQGQAPTGMASIRGTGGGGAGGGWGGSSRSVGGHSPRELYRQGVGVSAAMA